MDVFGKLGTRSNKIFLTLLYSKYWRASSAAYRTAHISRQDAVLFLEMLKWDDHMGRTTTKLYYSGKKITAVMQQVLVYPS